MTRRYPIEPLLALLRDRGLCQTDAGKLTGLSGSSMKAAIEHGLIVKAADRTAQRAGYHPAEVWPSWFDDALEDHGRDCATCGVRFTPYRSTVLYCSQRCRRLIQQRRYRANPTVAERNRERRRAAYAETAEYERARQRRYYEANREAIRARRQVKSDRCSSADSSTTLHVETSGPGAALTARDPAASWLEDTTMDDDTSREASAA